MPVAARHCCTPAAAGSARKDPHPLRRRLRSQGPKAERRGGGTRADDGRKCLGSRHGRRKTACRRTCFRVGQPRSLEDCGKARGHEGRRSGKKSRGGGARGSEAVVKARQHHSVIENPILIQFSISGNRFEGWRHEKHSELHSEKMELRCGTCLVPMELSPPCGGLFIVPSPSRFLHRRSPHPKEFLLPMPYRVGPVRQ